MKVTVSLNGGNDSGNTKKNIVDLALPTFLAVSDLSGLLLPRTYNGVKVSRRNMIKLMREMRRMKKIHGGMLLVDVETNECDIKIKL